MTAVAGSKKRSKKSSRTYGKGDTPAEMLGVILNSPLGAQVADVLSSAMARVFGVDIGAQKYQRLKEEAQEARRNFEESKANPYKILGVDPDAEQEVVKAAYRELAKKYHPDHNPDSKRMGTINQAYEQILLEKGWKK